LSLLLALAELITDAMYGVQEASSTSTLIRRTDIDPFVRRLEDVGVPRGLVRHGDDTLSLGEAILVYAVEPLVTPEGRGLADVAVDQLESHGTTIERVWQPSEHARRFWLDRRWPARSEDPRRERLGVPDQQSPRCRW
jgi:hypothetical protein